MRTTGRATLGSAAVSRSVYLTATGPASGKSAVTLSVVQHLVGRVGRVGFFRPIVHAVPDNDLELMRAQFELPAERIGYAFDSNALTELEGGAPGADNGGLATVLAAYKGIEAASDFVVIEGSDFSGASAPLELDVNARLARHLGSPVIVVVNGHDLEPAAIVARVDVVEDTFDARRQEVVGVVVNRVPPDRLAELEALLPDVGIDAPVWTLPDEPMLRRPTLGQLADALDADVLGGVEDELGRPVGAIKVAAMTVGNVLDHVEDGAVLITPGDRSDLIAVAALTRHSSAYPSVAGVVLSGGLAPDDRIRGLIDNAAGSAAPMPLVLTTRDTFETAVTASAVEGAITPHDVAKIEHALAVFESRVDQEELSERIRLAKSDVVTPVMFQYELIERARAAAAHIVLPEGTEDRILEAAQRLRRRQVCDLTLLGPVGEVRRRIDELGLAHLDEVDVIDPMTSPLRAPFADRYFELRRHKGIRHDQAVDLMSDVSFFGTMMVHEGLVGGMVSGAAHTTAHTIIPALEFVRTRPGVTIVSSVFLMLLSDRVLVYGDCAVNPDPNAEQLADIAISSAETALLFGIEPRIAMLSYSTGESGAGADVEKVRTATERVRQLRPDLPVEGPIQYDAAIDPAVGRTKLPGSAVAGNATVFIFPDLNTGNNTYKAVQRSADAIAVGPVLQGLNKPVNDLSRGATVPDIVNTVAITAIQAGSGLG